MQHNPQVPDDYPNGDEWAALMLRAQAGDNASYHALLQSVAPYLRSITRRYLGRGGTRGRIAGSTDGGARHPSHLRTGRPSNPG
jgi:hypothetical protein